MPTVEEAIAEQKGEPTEEEKDKARNEALWAQVKAEADAAEEAKKKIMPVDPGVEEHIQYLQGLREDIEGSYEERLRRQVGAQAMAKYRTEGPGGQMAQTTQQMGSRGMGRMAQVANLSEQQYLHELIQGQNLAAETAMNASREITSEIGNMLKLNLETQAEVHQWDVDQKTHMQNQFNEAITVFNNIWAEQMSAGNLDTESEWEEIGKRSAAFMKDFMAATTDEERRQAIADHYGEAYIAIAYA